MAYTLPGVVADGQVITAAHLNDIRTAIVELQQSISMQVLTLTPGSITGPTSGTLVDFFTIGTLTVPTWATTAYVQVNIDGIVGATATSAYVFGFEIGTVATSSIGQLSFEAIAERRTLAYAGSVASPPTGNQLLVVQAARTAGTGTANVDGTVKVSALAFYTKTH